MGKKSIKNALNKEISASSKGVSPSTKRKLASLSGNTCANPDAISSLLLQMVRMTLAKQHILKVNMKALQDSIPI
jgi:hypothetical protein